MFGRNTKCYQNGKEVWRKDFAQKIIRKLQFGSSNSSSKEHSSISLLLTASDVSHEKIGRGPTNRWPIPSWELGWSILNVCGNKVHATHKIFSTSSRAQPSVAHGVRPVAKKTYGNGRIWNGGMGDDVAIVVVRGGKLRKVINDQVGLFMIIISLLSWISFQRGYPGNLKNNRLVGGLLMNT